MYSLVNNCLRFLRVYSTGLKPTVQICCSSNLVPSSPQWKEIKDEDLPPPRVLTPREVEHLESISLVQYKNTAVEKARLENTIRFADSLHVINTDDVEPMVHVYDDVCLRLRKDAVTEPGSASDILRNASETEEDYFVAPPGNVALLDADKFVSNKNSS